MEFDLSENGKLATLIYTFLQSVKGIATVDVNEHQTCKFYPTFKMNVTS